MDPEYEEMDIFEIDLDHVPLPVQHICLLSGVEYEVWSFEASLVESVKENRHYFFSNYLERDILVVLSRANPSTGFQNCYLTTKAYTLKRYKL